MRIPRPSLMTELRAGMAVGEYELQAQIGEGAMGTVWAGIQPKIGKRVAIKVLKPELCANQKLIDRFVQEAQAVNQISHINIVDVFSLGELPDGRAYLVMELLRGTDLKTRLSRPLALRELCDILDGIARALEAAHAKGIVHRDLKPENVFLHQLDTGALVKLLDFGIAKLLNVTVRDKTQTGSLIGTPAYMSPEQARGVDVDHRADLYSLGVIAYEMLAHRPPFIAETAMDLIICHINEPPPPLATFAKDVPRALEQLVMRMLAKNAADRPTLAEIRAVLAHPGRAASLAKRRWLWIGAAMAAIAVVLASTLSTPSAVAVPSVPTLSTASTVPTAPTAPIAPTAPTAIVMTPTKLPPPPPTPVMPTHATLAITIEGSPTAEIKVDGEPWARGAFVSRDATVGTHAIEILANGERITRSVEVVAEHANRITIVTKRAHGAPPVARTTTRDDEIILAPKGH